MGRCDGATWHKAEWARESDLSAWLSELLTLTALMAAQLRLKSRQTGNGLTWSRVHSYWRGHGPRQRPISWFTLSPLTLFWWLWTPHHHFGPIGTRYILLFGGIERVKKNYLGKKVKRGKEMGGNRKAKICLLFLFFVFFEKWKEWVRF